MPAKRFAHRCACFLLVALTVGACQSDDRPPADKAPEPVDYQAAVRHPDRPDADRERDAARKPAEVLAFIGVNPGMTVLDMFTGGGYYAELLSHVVGDGGKVIAQSNEAYLGFVGDAFQDRFESGRLTNTEVLMAENNELALEADQFDLAMLVLSFHDLYYADPENGWPAFDRDAFLAELRKGLKPGGVVAIIDHRGTAGTPPEESAQNVHRIDPAVVVVDMTAAGFKLKGKSDLLANADDDHTQNVFAEGVRGNTDRFIMTFESPD